MGPELEDQRWQAEMAPIQNKLFDSHSPLRRLLTVFLACFHWTGVGHKGGSPCVPSLKPWCDLPHHSTELIFLQAERSSLASNSELFLVNFGHWGYTNPTWISWVWNPILWSCPTFSFHFCVFVEVHLFKAQRVCLDWPNGWKCGRPLGVVGWFQINNTVSLQEYDHLKSTPQALRQTCSLIK